jgi:hypothetical protein
MNIKNLFDENEIITLPCGISGKSICCLDSCKDFWKIEDWQKSPNEKNAIDFCYDNGGELTIEDYQNGKINKKKKYT